jgi:hypothetical protein
MTRKFTVPFGTVFFVKANLNSAGLPVVIVTAETRPAPVAGSAHARPTTTAAAASANPYLTIQIS